MRLCVCVWCVCVCVCFFWGFSLDSQLMSCYVFF
jgi:hypothetical protein